MEIPDGYGQINLKFGGNACPTGAEITFGCVVESTVPTPLGTAEVVAAAWDVCDVMALLCNTLTLVSVDVKHGPAATGPSASLAVGTVGGFATPALPPNTSVLVKKVTIAGGRAGSGRFYLPGFVESGVTDSGTMSASTISQFDDIWDVFLNTCSTNDVPLVLLHGADSPITVPTHILGLRTQQKVATQRRRLRR